MAKTLQETPRLPPMPAVNVMTTSPLVPVGTWAAKIPDSPSSAEFASAVTI